jgi:enamine deaminase RidA (YjgF/YER057c/UK114 family)
MRRREFILGLGSAAAWGVVAWAQQPAMTMVEVSALIEDKARVEIEASAVVPHI